MIMNTSSYSNIVKHWLSRRSLVSWGLGLLLTASCGMALAGSQPKPAYDYYPTGDVSAVVALPSPTASSVVLMGGGPDVDDAFKWMIQKSGGGHFVVIRASGADGYNSYIYDMGGVTSVETLVIKNTDAANDDNFVLPTVSRANAVFIAGGDQSDYIKLWKNTKLATLLQTMMQSNVPMGGTSAGLAVLGEFDFAALNGTVTSDKALADPYNRYMTIDTGFLAAPGLAATIADAHLDTRDRMGRLLAFVARMIKPSIVGGIQMGCDGGTLAFDAARGIGVDVETALLVEGSAGSTKNQRFTATRVGVGSVYFLSPSQSPVVCAMKQPLTFRNVMVTRLSGSGSFNLSSWSGSGLATYNISAEVGVLVPTNPY